MLRLDFMQKVYFNYDEERNEIRKFFEEILLRICNAFTYSYCEVGSYNTTMFEMPEFSIQIIKLCFSYAEF